MLAGMLTASQLAACTGARIDRAQLFLAPLVDAMQRYAIDTPQRMSMFLPNLGHESAGLSRLVENLNYSADALIAKFSRERISRADALAFGRTNAHAANQPEIAKRIYGGTWGRLNLGNTLPDDGWRFRAYGPMQTTGRANVEALTLRLRERFPMLPIPDFVAKPDLLVEPPWGALSAADYWDMRGLNAWADKDDFDGVCDLINRGRKTQRIGDSNGWTERVRLLDASKKSLGIA